MAIAVALILDTVWGLLLKGAVTTELTFNMFYISPFYNSSLPVFRDIQPNVPYPVFLLLYVTAFCIGAAAIWFGAFGVRKALARLRGILQ